MTETKDNFSAGPLPACRMCWKSFIPVEDRDGGCENTNPPEPAWVVRSHKTDSIKWVEVGDNGAYYNWTENAADATVFTDAAKAARCATTAPAEPGAAIEIVPVTKKIFDSVMQNRAEAGSEATSCDEFEAPNIPGVTAVQMDPQRPEQVVNALTDAFGRIAGGFNERFGKGHRSVKTLDRFKTYDDMVKAAGAFGSVIHSVVGEKEVAAAKVRFEFRQEVVADLRKMLFEIDCIGTKALAAHDLNVANDLSLVRRQLCLLLSGSEWIKPDEERMKEYGLTLEERLKPLSDLEAGKPAWVLTFKKPAEGDEPRQERDYGVYHGLTACEAVEKLLDKIMPYAPATAENEQKNHDIAYDRVELRRWMIATPAH